MARRSGALALALATAGCGQPVPPCGVPGLTSQVVVIAAYRHEEAESPPDGSPDTAPGLDLDGITSDGTGPDCVDEFDYRSRRSGALGVDNQYAAYVLPLLATLPEYASGVDSVVLAELAGGRDLVAFAVRVDAGGFAHADVLTLEPTAPVRVDPDGLALEADQRFRESSRESTTVRCGERSLELGWPNASFPMGEPIDGVAVRDVRVRLEVDPSGALRTGELGARVPLDEAVRFARAVGGDLVDESIARALARPDLDASAENRDWCGSLSLGVGVDLVPAVLVE